MQIESVRESRDYSAPDRGNHAMKRGSSGDRLPTICFVLTAKDLGLHADMAGVAALAVRRLHRQARIILVTDEPTARGIDHAGHALGNIVSEIIGQQTGADDPIVSSRRLKTVLRHVVKAIIPIETTGSPAPQRCCAEPKGMFYLSLFPKLGRRHSGKADCISRTRKNHRR